MPYVEKCMLDIRVSADKRKSFRKWLRACLVLNKHAFASLVPIFLSYKSELLRQRKFQSRYNYSDSDNVLCIIVDEDIKACRTVEMLPFQSNQEYRLLKG